MGNAELSKEDLERRLGYKISDDDWEWACNRNKFGGKANNEIRWFGEAREPFIPNSGVERPQASTSTDE